MINRTFDLIDNSDIENLIKYEVAEGKTIEYKEQISISSDSDKKEFLADISAFANSSGGDLVYGMIEQRDDKNHPTGIPKQADGLDKNNTDELIRQLDSIIQSGLAPRIMGVQIKAISGFSQGSIILIRIPKSWNSPHMVIFKGSSRFYARNSAGKYPLDVDELRSAFISSESLAEKLRQFRVDRIAKVSAQDTPVQLTAVPRLVLHCIPIEAFNSSRHIDIKAVGQQNLPLKLIGESGWSRRYNFDGFLHHNQFAYTQLFRNGVIEAVNDPTSKQSPHDQDKLIPSIKYEKDIIESLNQYLNTLKQLQINPPVLVMLSLLNVQGYRLTEGDRSLDVKPIERDILLVPEVIVEDYDTEVSRVLQPVFDTIWQACGLQQCWNYNDDGIWVGRR